jgi:MYXO-CTERM domain-containing protein
LLFFAAQLVAVFAVVAMREGLGLSLPMWVGSGVGGALGVALVGALAARRRSAQQP